MDLDIGLALAILNRERYRELGARLRDAGFEPKVNEQGNTRLQTWTVGTPHPVSVDFLIPPTEQIDEGSSAGQCYPVVVDSDLRTVSS